MSETYIVIVLVPIGLLSPCSGVLENPTGSPDLRPRVTTRDGLGNTGRRILPWSISAASPARPRCRAGRSPRAGSGRRRVPNNGARSCRRGAIVGNAKATAGGAVRGVQGTAATQSGPWRWAMFATIWQVFAPVRPIALIVGLPRVALEAAASAVTRAGGPHTPRRRKSPWRRAGRAGDDPPRETTAEGGRPGCRRR